MPVTMPAEGAAPSYRPSAARAAISRKGVPGSRRRSTRSRTGSLPCSRWRRCASSPPPARAAARCAFSSASSASMCARFALNSGEEVSIWLAMTGMGSGAVCHGRGNLLTGAGRREQAHAPSTRPERRAMRLLSAVLVLAAAAPVLAAATDDPPPAPMDLVWDATDVNGVALNPKRGPQVTDPGMLPDVPEICFVQPDGPFDSTLCSTQVLGIDKPIGLKRLICSIGATTSLPAHVHWYPGTFEGPVYWDSQSFADRDDNVRLVPADQNALTTHNPDNIKGEFDSRETTAHFATKFWTDFRKAGDRGKRSLIDGKAAIISGFTSVDCEHNCVSELHPVWVLAIHVKDDPEDDAWVVFMRNWGDEGFCSSLQHEVSWPRDRFTLILPWRAGASAVDLDPA